jgi:LacI family transcriptional regulator
VAEATRYLIAQGHRRIGLITGPHGFRSSRERRQGFEDALAEAGIKLPRSLIADGNYTFESGISATQSLLDVSPRPTAIFASNDDMAAGVLLAARQRGLAVPEQLSIIGFDDQPLAARVWPPLTTVHWPMEAMGRSAALKLIADMIDEDNDVEEPSMFVSTLVKRGSVAPPEA